MKKIATLAFLTALFAAPAWSQEVPKDQPGDQKDRPLPCVDVQIGQDEAPAFNCMNDALRAQVERAQNNPAIQAPIDARSASNQVGTFNNQAAQEQMGDAYGVSAHPQRPKPVFVIPLIPSTPR